MQKTWNFRTAIFIQLFDYCVARATLWFCSGFFSYAADLNLFQETGKGQTCAVFAESVDLRPDWWIWHYILESSAELFLGLIRMVFACPRARAYGVRSEVELYSLCQRWVSEVLQPSFRFIKPCFCFRVESSVPAGKQAGKIGRASCRERVFRAV